MVIKTKSLNEISAMANCKPINKQSALTVGENIIGALKIRNNYSAILLFIHPRFRQKYWPFSVFLHVKL